jgi:hypothetical protein
MLIDFCPWNEGCDMFFKEIIMFENKIVAVMNKSVDPGVVMNALAHACIGLGARLGIDALNLDMYIDKEGHEYPNISRMPFIILSANSNKIRGLYEWAQASNVRHAAFLDTMTGGTYIEQLERTKNTAADKLNFYGIVLFGPWDEVSQATKKFSLWK